MVDLHTHSTASDGNLSPTELVQRAAAAGLTALALTDHDTMAGCGEAMVTAKQAAAAGSKLRVIPGIELEADYPHYGACHIVGLSVDPTASRLATVIDEAAESRLTRNMILVQRLREAGIAVSADELPGGLARAGRLHFAQRLIDGGIVNTIQEAFTQYLGPGAETYAQRIAPRVARCVGAIHAAGGVSVLAHPSTLRLSWTRLYEQLRVWQEAGLEAIEVYYPGAFRRTTTKLIALAARLGLRCSGGSDFHDGSRELGQVFGREIPDAMLGVLEKSD
ncbi:MAG: PHP domain-containing protein [Spirochaetes bacterium]|jgi:predicted metal-dependent phosphoesterase TrpH|nr:PHP domain-containing protein [Spirochaetota bacterium]